MHWCIGGVGQGQAVLPCGKLRGDDLTWQDDCRRSRANRMVSHAEVNRSGEGDAPHGRVAEFLDWLASPPNPDPAAEVTALRERIDGLPGLGGEPSRLDSILDALAKRAGTSAGVVRRLVRDAGDPVPEPNRRTARELASVFAGIVEADRTDGSGGRPRKPAIAAARSLECLAQGYRLGLLAGAPAPAGLWRDAHRLYREVRAESGPSQAAIHGYPDAARTYREMLALAAVQPSCLSAVELLAASDYGSRFAATVEITDRVPEEPDYRSFWLDQNLDMAPVAVARKLPPRGEGIVFVSCARLGLLAAEQVRELEAGTDAEHLHLPPEAGEASYRGLLQRLHDAWVEPPSRHLARRHNRRPVEVCIGFDLVRDLLAQKAPGDAGIPAHSSWMVLNESPSGFAIAHAKGDVGALVTGGVVALRSDAQRPWDVCVVRWLRAASPERIEAGLQVLSCGARPVRIAFRGARNTGTAVAGLLVPAAPAVRAHEAILVPAGSCASRRFLMVTDEEHTHVVQGRMVNLDLQTALVELFEFQPDPYPV